MAGSKTKFEQFVINKVREKRLENNLSQDDLALMLDLSRGYIGQVESPNHPAKYNMNHINHLAKEFKCSPKDFFPDKPTIENLKKRKIRAGK
ncbi:MAG: helix-turn-helix transcriptional regulator [Chitinophagaceae bacterium]|nr:helix-turn-helix transcriptional regulator [Chitinophagaceae bacterium]MCB9056145.1 helix-turn-helix transcriptional regulator [Chitinophagales bacterium]